MANREYYGESVPAHLYGEETRNFSTMQCPEYNPTQQWNNNTGPPSYEQTPVAYQQQPWADPNNLANVNNAEGEKGLGSTVVGGAGGSYVGHQVGKKSDHGTLGTIGGAVAGAVMANMASNAMKGKHHQEQAQGQGCCNNHGCSNCHQQRLGLGGGRMGLGLGGSLVNRRVGRLERRMDRLHGF
ncbi:hypothetical protein ASPSYDRAFT_917016 [Aspergillus sydowii CBS 593.65]|uniref:Glycine zipper 2TM domain-containing protein n=1 Tax=Aspergillus sydowii CBS 593.65 TaxID=1036612 RepID=A0A1L9TKQ9_9EURO|nr:uncharacterized protein ASPSYDRAFT_917016 [Aspergillus sydowii CBS 593.65]OJJ60000.1 hypothetical protein ASPSYDRAFT_917016 [Aspergillus sydowii CBS 593.65]